MTSNRAYRQGMDAGRALSLLLEDARNGALDSGIVDMLVRVVHRDGLLWKATDEAA
jgi:HD-GYP domain-containing protein (c-di-GMP phosphodiesterase class II)